MSSRTVDPSITNTGFFQHSAAISSGLDLHTNIIYSNLMIPASPCPVHSRIDPIRHVAAARRHDVGGGSCRSGSSGLRIRQVLANVANDHPQTLLVEDEVN